MKTLATLAFVATLPACETEQTAPTCSAKVVQTWPADGATDVFGLGKVEFYLDKAIGDYEVVAAVGGETSTREDGRVIVFTPSEGFAPNAGHEVTLTGCLGEHTIGFSTNSYGEALQADVEGKVYLPDVFAARFYDNEALTTILGDYMSNDLLVKVQKASGGQLDILVGRAVEDSNPPVQDDCLGTWDLPAGDFASPSFEIGPLDFSFGSTNGPATILDLHLTGTFSPDGSTIGGVTLEGWADLREPAEGDLDTAQAYCDLAGALGASCEACPDDGEIWCIAVAADDLYADEVSATVEPVAATCE